MIRIIDYGMGNLRSVANAFEAVGAPVSFATDPGQLDDAGAIVLPGVGAFGDGMRNLRERGFVAALERRVQEQRTPFLGLCLGMQLLARRSFEYGEHAGLGWVDGDVVRLPSDSAAEALRVPHVGWNEVEFRTDSRLYRGLGQAESFYFVHSYHLVDAGPEWISGECDYGIRVAASVENGHVFATQFHPEKSHRAGLTVLRNFADLSESGDA